MKRNYTPAQIYPLALILLSILAWFAACEDKEDFVPLRIFAIEPAEAYIGDTIAIIGEGFSPGMRYNRVFFPGSGGAVQPLDNSTEEKLWVQVPEGIGSGIITVNLFDEEIAETPIPLSVKIPVIKEIVPAEGLAGDTVVLHGENFRPAAKTNRVVFFPESAGVVVSGTTTELKVIVPQSSTTGNIRILGFAGPTFKIIPPYLTGISPLKGIVGQTISILGRGLNPSATTLITFNGSATATPLETSTTRELKVVVPANAQDGAINITFGGYSFTTTQVFEVYPSITSISPRSGAPNMTITINGFGFSNTIANNTVYFNGLQATVTSATRQQLRAVVPAGTTAGPVTVKVNGRNADGPVFQISEPGTPVILALDPDSGPIGSLMAIKGTDFSAVPSENTVKFTNNVTAQVVSATATKLTVRVPEGAVTGEVTVTKDNKTGTGPEFTIAEMAKAFVTSVSPAMVAPGGGFTIYGGNFSTVRENIQVDLVANFTSKQIEYPNTATATELTHIIPSNTTPGEYGVRIRQFGGGVLSDETITVEGNPQITALSLTEGFVGSKLMLTGTAFHNIETKNTVTFTKAGVSTNATTYVIPGDASISQVTVEVPQLDPGVYDVSLTAFGHTSNTTPLNVKVTPLEPKNIYYASKSGNDITLEKLTFGETDPQVIYENTGANIKTIAIQRNADGTGKVYFASADRIARSNFDGTGYQELFTGSDITSINDITLDIAGGKIYWSAGKFIRRGDITGGTVELIYTSPAAPALGPTIKGLTYCAGNNMLYFCEQVGTAASTRTSVMRVDPSATITTPVTPLIPQMNPAPADLKIDYINDKMFLLCGISQSSTIGTRRNVIRANLDGTSATSVHSYPGSTINGIALDTEHQWVYWIKHESNTEGGSGVYRKKYDGSGDPEQLYTVTDQHNGGIAGLALELPNSSGANQRGFGSLSIEFMMYHEDE